MLCSRCGSDHEGGFDYAAPGTRHYTLMYSNEAPLDSDLPFLASAISKIDARLGCMDDEITCMDDEITYIDDEINQIPQRPEEQLVELRRKRVSLLRYRARNRRILSPLRRLPPEVLAEIFAWTLPTDPKNNSIQISQSPWLLSHINRYWRTVCISTPSLWSFFAIDYDEPVHYPLPMVEAHIARAKKSKSSSVWQTTRSCGRNSA
ncbi:hypothetical protein B0H16DRAFT_664592 [Mycena metata]|uniref:F-box domain-containing protein n=1 Tax=Mycena metata TaxID=1033252 RepID=A0AAD7J6K4_9AGAR|nr:hypothetical protein B0H16DRAFT_664592 [Mycena metata]